jgi:CheY-like chemotaxis protein
MISSIQLHQILMNLGINAGDAIGDKGRIDVEAAVVRLGRMAVCASCHRNFSGDYVVISVRDTGSGIAPENLAKVFDPFFSTKETGRGSGLGLSVLHGIVHSANGHVEVHTEVGAGTEFRVYLPSRPGAGLAVIPDADSKAAREQVCGRILLVDDEPDIVEFMAALLENIGCSVRGFSNPVEAWRIFQEAPDEVDLVITDQTMPDMTGAELARAMLACRPDLPIILSTGYSTAIDDSAAREIGIRRLLKKPIASQVLRDLVVQYLPHKNAGSPG